MKNKLTDLKHQLEELLRVEWHPDVVKAKEKVLAERQPKIDALKKQIEDLRSKQPKPSARWTDKTPELVKFACRQYWAGTEEYLTYRIHCWNDKAVWTSYPSGGYSNNGGWQQTPPCYYLLSLIDKEDHL